MGVRVPIKWGSWVPDFNFISMLLIKFDKNQYTFQVSSALIVCLGISKGKQKTQSQSMTLGMWGKEKS